MKFKGLVCALAVCLTLFGCGGGGGSSTNITLRTVVLVHPAAVGSTFGSDDVTVSGSQTGNVVTQVASPVFTGFNLVTTTLQTFTATDVTASPNITLGTYTQTATNANSFYTMYVTGIEGNTAQYAPAGAILQENPPAVVPTSVWVRMANFSSSAAGAVDVYFTASATSSLSGVTPTITAAGYGQPTNYVTLAGGTYYIRVTASGQPSNLLYTSGAYTFSNGFYYTNYGWDATPTTVSLYTSQDIY